MASGALIPKRSDVMALVPGQNLHEISAHIAAGECDLNNHPEIFGQIQKRPSNQRYIRRDSAERLSPIRRSTSAQSVGSNYAKNRQHYQKCIEYLQEQHKNTLSKLHQEVQDLKHENKKLHFKILVEDEGGAAAVVRQTLSINTEKTNISNELLLQETIKDLKVKLKLSEDSISHQATTIKNLNKQIKMFKRVPAPLVPRPPGTRKSKESTQDLSPVKNELLAKNKMIAALELERDQQKTRIDELQMTLRALRLKLEDQSRDRHLVAGSSGSSIHSGSPRTTVQVPNFVVANSGSNGNLVNMMPLIEPALKPMNTKLPPLSKGQKSLSGLPSSDLQRNQLVPKNSRVDIAKRSRRLQQIKNSSKTGGTGQGYEFNDDSLL